MEELEIIRSVMDQHKVLLDQINHVNVAMSDKDALIKLDKAQAELAVDLRRPLTERRDYVIRSLITIAQGLKRHYDFEEEKLPPLLGQLLTDALIIEHKILMAEINGLIAMIKDINLKGLNHIDEISQEAVMNESLSALRDKKLDHQIREEAVLITLQYICEEKAKQTETTS